MFMTSDRRAPIDASNRFVLLSSTRPRRVLSIKPVELRDPDRDEVAVRVTAISLNRGETRRAVCFDARLLGFCEFCSRQIAAEHTYTQLRKGLGSASTEPMPRLRSPQLSCRQTGSSLDLPAVIC
jgi:hypothetical protein